MMEGPQFEEWRVCAGYDGYEVSNLGRVRSSQDGRILSQSWAGDNHGKRYRTAGVCQKTTTYVHRLVAAAFLGEAPPGARYVDHIDNDPDNNRPENLRWTTNGANMRNQAVTATKWPGISFYQGRWLLQLCGSTATYTTGASTTTSRRPRASVTKKSPPATALSPTSSI